MNLNSFIREDGDLIGSPCIDDGGIQIAVGADHIFLTHEQFAFAVSEHMRFGRLNMATQQLQAAE